MKREYFDDSKELDFKFFQTTDDFKVDEIPHAEFKGKGNFLILKVKKIELTTWDMIAIFAEYLRIPAQKIGYAGLKDKHATTTQYISVEAKHEDAIKKFKNPQIKILSKTRDANSIQMGSLKGNRFSINLHEIDNIEAGQIEKKARKIAKNGLPNYFGYQRFGREKESLEQAKEMIQGDLYINDAKIKKFLISIYQSHFFNEWLKERVQLSKEKNDGNFMLLSGDIYSTQNNKLRTIKEIPTRDFLARKLTPTGLLCGRDVFRSRYDAREIEVKYDDEFLQEKGYRRDALIFPEDIVCKYDKKQTLLNISFSLKKGSYATVFLEAIAARNYTANDVKKK